MNLSSRPNGNICPMADRLAALRNQQPSTNSFGWTGQPRKATWRQGAAQFLASLARLPEHLQFGSGRPLADAPEIWVPRSPVPPGGITQWRPDPEVTATSALRSEILVPVDGPHQPR